MNSPKDNLDLAAAIKALRKNRIGAYHVADKKELISLINNFIPNETLVGCGDSVTLEELGVFDELRRRNIQFLDKYVPTLTKEEKREIYRKNFYADTFITGTNAVTMDGKLFNIDGNGSRVAPMIYGPKQVLVVVGINKLVKDTQEAIERTRQIAATLDAKRLKKGTPCTVLGRCIDCSHKDRICNDFVLIAGQFEEERIKVIFIEGEYGY
jgi:L-lactate utilization protein LutB